MGWAVGEGGGVQGEGYSPKAFGTPGMEKSSSCVACVSGLRGIVDCSSVCAHLVVQQDAGDGVENERAEDEVDGGRDGDGHAVLVYDR